MKNFLRIIALILSLFSLASCEISLPNNDLHGAELSAFTDDELYETIYFQNLDIVDSYESEEVALEEMNSVRKTVYILSMYEYEISNGGLCQFFVNSTRELAPYVSRCLDEVGATEHKNLFDSFISDNNINVYELESFVIDDLDEFSKQNERYDFDSFDEEYDKLPFLRAIIVEYIRKNINEF